MVRSLKLLGICLRNGRTFAFQNSFLFSSAIARFSAFDSLILTGASPSTTGDGVSEVSSGLISATSSALDEGVASIRLNAKLLIWAITRAKAGSQRRRLAKRERKSGMKCCEAHQHSKPRLGRSGSFSPVCAIMDVTSPAPFTFERVSLSPPGGKMSPGSIFGNRIALGPNQEEDIFWSTGSSLFRLSLGPAPPPPVAVTNYDGKLLLPTPNERSGKSVAIESLNGAKHSSEIQNLSVVSSDLLHLYSVDSLGQVLVNSFGIDGHNSTVALPAPSSISEHGWVGIASHKALPGICATARYCDKLVTVYDQDRVVSRFKTIAHPMQVRMLDNGMLVMTEQGSFSIWDLRLPSAAILPR